MMMVTTMFIACLVKKLLPVCRAWNVTICSLTPARWLYFTIISCALVLFRWARLSSQHAFLCVKHWVVDRCVSYRLLVTKCLCVQCPCPSDALSCVRETLRLPNVACFVLASPFQWLWHCYGAHILYCWSYSVPLVGQILLRYYTTVHVKLSAEKTVLPVCRQLKLGVSASSREEIKMPFTFFLPLALLIGSLVVFKALCLCMAVS